MADRRALVITSPGVIGLQEAAELVPGPGEVVAREVHTGICGTDLELVAGVVDPAYTRYPLVPGHEWSGIIEASASFAYTSAAWAEVTALLSAGQIRLSPLITHRFPLEAYEDAYQVLRSSSGPRGKVLLEVSEP